MPIHNADLARVFDEIGDLLEIQGANAFRIRAYRNAARTVGEHGSDLAAVLAAGGELPRLPGIGADLAAKVGEIAATGSCALLTELRREIPQAVTALLRVPGLGPKRVQALWRQLDVRTLDDLRRAALEQRIRGIAGFGERTEARILEAVEVRANAERRFKLATAAQYAEALAAHLRRVPGAGEVALAGSYRRLRETVGDLDIVAMAHDGRRLMEAFTGYEEVREVLAGGPTRASVVLRCGLQVDLRCVEPESFGAAMCYFTGSKAHNIAVRRLAQERGLKINEYGVFREEQRIAGETEASVYAEIGLPWIPPELREGRGEIEAARAGRLPRLVERRDLRGDLHVHTRASDGRASLREMAEAARERGLEYIAVTDHSQGLPVAGGLDPQRLRAQGREIDRLNRELSGITLLKGIEAEILEDGRLDLADDVLAGLDLVVGAVHSRFDLPRERQTQRILRALDHPRLAILAHPSGRLIDEREPCDLDMERIIRRAAERGCCLELNANPARLDLGDLHCMAARERKVPVAIDSDAHAGADFDHLRFGIGQARRGWLEAADVLNTRPLAEVRAWLRRRGKDR